MKTLAGYGEVWRCTVWLGRAWRGMDMSVLVRRGGARHGRVGYGLALHRKAWGLSGLKIWELNSFVARVGKAWFGDAPQGMGCTDM